MKTLAAVGRLGCVLLCAVFAGCTSIGKIDPLSQLSNESWAKAKNSVENRLFSREDVNLAKAVEEADSGARSGTSRRSDDFESAEGRANSVSIVSPPSGESDFDRMSELQPSVTAVFSDDAMKVSLLTPIEEVQKVSETFVENDVQEALQILASQAKTQIIIDDMVHGVTSAVIEDEPFESALDKVLLPLGYVYRKVKDQYLVGLPDPTSNLFPLIAERYDYHTRNLAPSELMELLPKHFSDFVRTSEKRNLIIIEAPPKIAESVIADLDRSDQPVDQVVLEVMICVFSPDNSVELGVDLTHRNTAFNLALAGLNLAAASGTIPGVQDFTHSSASLRALSRRGHVSIRATPRVMAKDGELAKISIAKETFFSVQPANNGAFFRQEIKKIEAGISLDITPVIRGDRVTLKIDRAEVSEGIDNPNTSAGAVANTFPTINRRHVSTTVNVLDQETITIGGLIQRQAVEQTNKVPLLGDLPYLGRLFQRVSQREEETEVIIFITPRIAAKDLP